MGAIINFMGSGQRRVNVLVFFVRDTEVSEEYILHTLYSSFGRMNNINDQGVLLYNLVVWHCSPCD